MTATQVAPTRPAVMTRREYLDASSAEYAAHGTSTQTHRAYYAQFVTKHTQLAVLQRFGIDQLRSAFARDPHLNTIPLKQWDALSWHSVNTGGRSYPHRHFLSGPFVAHLAYNNMAIVEAGESLTRAVLVCIAKEAARQLIENEGVISWGS